MGQEEKPAGPLDELPEGSELIDDEVQEELNRRERAIREKIFDRVASDPAFKQKMLDSPSDALAELGVAQEMEELDPEMGAVAGVPDVSGQARYHTKYFWRCRRYSYRRKLYHWYVY